MSKGLIFWVLMLIWAVFSGLSFSGQISERWGWGGNLLIFILFLLLGWAVFGEPVK